MEIDENAVRWNVENDASISSALLRLTQAFPAHVQAATRYLLQWPASSPLEQQRYLSLVRMMLERPGPDHSPQIRAECAERYVDVMLQTARDFIEGQSSGHAHGMERIVEEASLHVADVIEMQFGLRGAAITGAIVALIALVLKSGDGRWASMARH